MPSLVTVYKQFKDQGFNILAVNLNANLKPVTKFVKNFKLPFPIFLDPQGKVAEAYKVFGLPYTIILDRAGVIRYKIYGGHEWDKGAALEKIKSLM